MQWYLPQTAELFFPWNLPPFCSSGNSNFFMMTMAWCLTLCPKEWRCSGEHDSEVPSFHILPGWFMSCIPWWTVGRVIVHHGWTQAPPASTQPAPTRDTANKGLAMQGEHNLTQHPPRLKGATKHQSLGYHWEYQQHNYLCHKVHCYLLIPECNTCPKLDFLWLGT